MLANLPIGTDTPERALAADGVACAACHQIMPDGLGNEDSFVGGYRIATDTPSDGRPVYGPFEPDAGGEGIMHSATGFRPTEGPHVQSSELCATCHTLFTHAIGATGAGPEFPEQTPYLEWRASAFAAEETSCQDCHMPVVGEDVPVTGVLGVPRPDVSRHVFRGGNFFMLRMLNRFRGELGVVALPQELDRAASATEAHLRESTASVEVAEAERIGTRLSARVEVGNRAGHKFPTAYPSRRAWLHVTVVDGRGRTVFESGAFSPDGRIVGNDNDRDRASFEPHYREVSSPDQVQIYEAVMGDEAGVPTTGLLSAHAWLKENRLLPRGFSPAAADARVRPGGEASGDPDFQGGSDRTTYSVDVSGAEGPFTFTAELWYQPVGYRWAENLGAYDAFETRRFLRYYREMAAGSALMIASGSTLVP